MTTGRINQVSRPKSLFFLKGEPGSTQQGSSQDPGFKRKKQTDSFSRFVFTLYQSRRHLGHQSTHNFSIRRNCNSYRQTSSHHTDREAHQETIERRRQLEPWPKQAATGSCPRCATITPGSAANTALQQETGFPLQHRLATSPAALGEAERLNNWAAQLEK